MSASFYVVYQMLMGLVRLTGLSYDAASVVICVLAPMVVFLVLCYFAFPSLFRRFLPTFARMVKAGDPGI